LPVVYIHGVAVREHLGGTPSPGPGGLIDHLLANISWEMIQPLLRRFIAPEISDKASDVPIEQVYWGDIGARMAWDGASCLPTRPDFKAPGRSRLLWEVRRPLNRLVAEFFGDVFSYLHNRGTADAPGPIPQRALATLAEAQAHKDRTGEPIVVLTNSMGGQIMYDVVTHFLPRLPEYSGIRVDFWCSVASQVALFEEMKLFLESSPEYSLANGNKAPMPSPKHLGAWWNVWDIDDIISYSAHDIFEGVDDSTFHVGKALVKEHMGYLQQESFYKLFAERIRAALPSDPARDDG